MSKRFERVIGTDPSAGMIQQAQKISHQHDSNITFRQGVAENSPFLRDAELDCVIAAQAAHWFDYARLWPEIRRIVRPGGTVAFWGYKDHVFVDFLHASEILTNYAYDLHPDMLGSYWPQPGRSYLQDQLRVIQPPADEWEDVTRVEYEPGTKGRHSGEGTLFMERSISVGECKEYMRTWSSYHGWRETHPGREARSKGGEGDVVDEMFDRMAETARIFGDDKNMVDIEWGSALVMARRK